MTGSRARAISAMSAYFLPLWPVPVFLMMPTSALTAANAASNSLRAWLASTRSCRFKSLSRISTEAPRSTANANICIGVVGTGASAGRSTSTALDGLATDTIDGTGFSMSELLALLIVHPCDRKDQIDQSAVVEGFLAFPEGEFAETAVDEEHDVRAVTADAQPEAFGLWLLLAEPL